MSSRRGLCVLVPVIASACGNVNINTDTGPGIDAAPHVDAAVIRTVNVQRTHSGSGTVTSMIGGIACGPTCVAHVPDGTSMVLTAAASAGSVFTGWSGPCTGTNSTCTFNVHGDLTVTATFDDAYHTVTVAPSGNGVGTVTSTPGAMSCPGTCSITV